MTKKLKLILAGIVLATLLSCTFFVSAGIDESITYLQAQTQNAWITQALVAADAENISTDHLTSVSGTTANEYSKAILALAALGEDPTTFGNVDYVAQLKTYYTDNQIGDVVWLNDDMWAILALAAVEQADSTQAIGAKNFLLDNQNTDGGWGVNVGDESNTNSTAAAIMALVEMEVDVEDSVITDAIDYVQSAQNDDGGIGYTVGAASDSASDAWVIAALNKIGIDAEDWEQINGDPITHLEGMEDTDGGFWYAGPDTSKAYTADAVIALSGETFPVDYYYLEDYDPEETTPGIYHLRIEGQTDTICDTDVYATTALDIVENGAEICDYTYAITESAYGPYLSQVNEEVAEGASGWLGFLNFISLTESAANYTLEEGDEVLFYYGEWGWQPTRVSIDTDEIDPGQAVNVTVEYFDGTSWLALPDAIIKVNSEERATNANGTLALTIYEDGVYQIYVDTTNYVRSDKITVTVGDTVNQSISLEVEIDQGGQIAGEAIAFTIDTDEIDFGTLRPGESAEETISLSNDGTVSLEMGASVSGDTVFTSGIKINQEHYDDYSELLAPAATESAAVSLTIPGSYLASGVKNGELIFWATAQ